MSLLGCQGGKSIFRKPECPVETTCIPYFLQVADFSFDFCRPITTTASIVKIFLGRERLWQLEPGRIEEAKRTLELIGREWEVALAKLKTFAESV